jgi:hypothetical protein
MDQLVCLFAISLRCIKFNINIQRKKLRESYKFWSIQDLVLPVAHRTLSGAQAKALRELAALGFSQSHSTKIHRIVRCGNGATVNFTNSRLR